jgi:hypothetical protein
MSLSLMATLPVVNPMPTTRDQASLVEGPDQPTRHGQCPIHLLGNRQQPRMRRRQLERLIQSLTGRAQAGTGPIAVVQRVLQHSEADETPRLGTEAIVTFARAMLAESGFVTPERAVA